MDTLLLTTLLLDGANSPGLLFTILVSAVSFFAGAFILSGIEIKNFISALIVAVVVSILNATVGKVMDVLALPITFLTLGLFRFVIDAIIILIAGFFLDNFKVKGFISALILAIVVSVSNSILFALF
ncbi:MAG: phage holin family protein [Bacteroidota bacterium]